MPKNRNNLPSSISHFLHSRKGFTLIELLIFAAIFSGMIIAFISVLVAVTSIHSRQSSVAEVNGQSQFLLQQIRQLTERSSVIELPEDFATTTLKLRMSSSTEDPTYITLANGIVYLQQGTGGENPLTSNKVTVSSLTFTKRSNPPGHDSVSVSFIVAYASPSAKQQFSETFNTAIARVSAATFDANLIPSSTATFDLGVTSNVWRSVNNTIYFSGSNVGIGTTGPGAKLHVVGDAMFDAGTPLILRNAVGTEAGRIVASSPNIVYRPGSAGDHIWQNSAGTELARITNSGNVGVGTAGPQSLLEVSNSGYFQFSRTSAGAPVLGDCDAAAERGRLVIDTTNNRLYVCNGAVRGWDWLSLTD